MDKQQKHGRSPKARHRTGPSTRIAHEIVERAKGADDVVLLI